jgi:hypothetical protein
MTVASGSPAFLSGLSCGGREMPTHKLAPQGTVIFKRRGNAAVPLG